MKTKNQIPALEIHDLSVSYDKKPVLWDIDLTVDEGIIAGIIGPNGAGKTSLIKACMGLIPAGSGFVSYFGGSLEKNRKSVGYIPQRGSVDWDFPASAEDVVMTGRFGHIGLIKRPRKIDREIVEESLEKVDMIGFRKRQIAQLSGGQQQRIFMARALAQQAELYFMDEPFAGVDAASEESIIGLLQAMKKEGRTMIIVHHDLQSAEKYFDQIILLNMRLVASGPTKSVFTKALIEETYGGKLTILTEVGELLEKQEFPIREKKIRQKP